jgi:threonyl-tRNA synthetase
MKSKKKKDGAWRWSLKEVKTVPVFNLQVIQVSHHLNYNFQEDAGGGLVFWHPKGAIVRHIIEDSWKKIHLQRGYEFLYTPHVAKAELWKISGHIDFYRENMYDQMDVENELYQLRPMNCPYHILLFKRKLHSYRDFPIRVAELGTVYRYELSGSLHGLFRVRGFTQVTSYTSTF